ncbi:hypothetical protein N2152v2_008908 [Parachlorella kessleri]
MAASKGSRQQFTPEECYYYAKDELITIVPNFSLPTENGTADCISGSFGPFVPNQECQVPIWLAHTLWKRKKCTIKAPDWLTAVHLEEVLELERQDASAFQPLPFHYIEVAHFLLQEGVHEMLAREVFGDEAQATEVKKMVGLVEQARMNKILQGLGTLQGAMTVKLNNLAAMEVNQVRAFFLGALDMFYKYQRMEEADVGTTQGNTLRSQGQTQPTRQLRAQR